jgi:hypothetical protein
VSESTLLASRESRTATIALKRYAVLAVLTSVAIFCQAVTAGQFVNKDGADSWITVHGVTADVSWVLALLTAVYALKAIRSSQPALACCSAILFVITLAQTGIGHLITDNGDDGLVAIHIPLAFLIFGLTIWISGRALRLGSS